MRNKDKYDDNYLRTTLFKENVKNLIFSLIGIFSKTLSALSMAKFTQVIIDQLSGSRAYSLQVLIAWAVIPLVALVIAAVLERHFWTAFRSQALDQYRRTVQQGILSKRLEVFTFEASSDYLSLISNDLNQVKDNYIESIPFIVELIFDFVGALLLMLTFNVRMSLLALALSLIPIAVANLRIKEVEKQELNLAKANARYIRFFSECLHGFRTIKSSRAEKTIEANLSVKSTEAAEAFARREKVEISIAYSAATAGLLVQIALLLIGFFMSRTDAGISVGIVVAFIPLVKNIIQVAISLPEQIAKLRASKSLMKQHAKLLTFQSAEGVDDELTCNQNIEIQNICALSPQGDQRILEQVTATLPAYGCYAIVGESGSGKTTLLNLLAGVHQNHTGSIRYDGREISESSERSKFNLISLIQQEVFVFQASLKDNITMFADCSERDLEQAAERAGLHELVEKRGWDYDCGTEGQRLSGGERQRVAIARSIVRKTPVLLLDEATSALDKDTAYQIIHTVLQMKDKTRIIVTHDLFPELLAQFDGILLMQNGKLIETGTYNAIKEKLRKIRE